MSVEPTLGETKQAVMQDNDCAAVISQNNLTKDNLILQDKPLTKGDVQRLNASEISLLKKLKIRGNELKVFVVKTGSAVSTLLLVWECVCITSALLFGKELPNIQRLAMDAHKYYDQCDWEFPDDPQKPESFYVYSENWEKCTPEQYRKEIQQYLDGNKPPSDLCATDTHFISLSGSSSSSSSTDDFWSMKS